MGRVGTEDFERGELDSANERLLAAALKKT